MVLHQWGSEQQKFGVLTSCQKRAAGMAILQMQCISPDELKAVFGQTESPQQG